MPESVHPESVHPTPQLVADEVARIVQNCLPNYQMEKASALLSGTSATAVWIRMRHSDASGFGECKIVVNLQMGELARRWFNEDLFERYVRDAVHYVHGPVV